MRSRRVTIVGLLSLTVLAGCAKLASLTNHAREERVLTVAHVADSALDVKTENGAVDVVGDLDQKDVKIVAKITTSGATMEEAKARLAGVKVSAERRRRDKVLVISVAFPGRRQSNDGCALEITVPSAKGATIHTSNGRVSVTRLAGPVKASSSNGALTADGVEGEVDLDTSNGSITFKAAGAPARFTLKTSNGSVKATLAKGATGKLTADTSNGSVDIVGAKADSVAGSRTSKTVRLSPEGPLSEIETSNGTITVNVE
jgi:DUF4097 and DUF4098 domain-containing protein YvlB